MLFDCTSTSFPILPLAGTTVTSLYLLSVFILFANSNIVLPPVTDTVSPSFNTLKKYSDPHLATSFIKLLLLSKLPDTNKTFFIPSLFFTFSCNVDNPITSFMTSLSSSKSLIPSYVMVIPDTATSISPCSLRNSVSDLTTLSLISSIFDRVLLPTGSLKDICLSIEYLLSISSITCGISFCCIFNKSFIYYSLLFTRDINCPPYLF